MVDSRETRNSLKLPSVLCRLLVAGGLFAPFLGTLAEAGTPSGPITCSIRGNSVDGQGFLASGVLFSPPVGAAPGRLVTRVVNSGSDCDGSMVSGTDAPIVEVSVSLRIKAHDTNCENFLSAPNFTNAILRLAWKGQTGTGRPVLLARTKVALASTAFDDLSRVWTLTTDPIDSGAFADQVVTLRLALEDDASGSVSGWFAACPDTSARLTGVKFGVARLSTIEVH